MEQHLGGVSWNMKHINLIWEPALICIDCSDWDPESGYYQRRLRVFAAFIINPRTNEGLLERLTLPEHQSMWIPRIHDYDRVSGAPQYLEIKLQFSSGQKIDCKYVTRGECNRCSWAQSSHETRGNIQSQHICILRKNIADHRPYVQIWKIHVSVRTFIFFSFG